MGVRRPKFRGNRGSKYVVQRHQERCQVQTAVPVTGIENKSDFRCAPQKTKLERPCRASGQGFGDTPVDDGRREDYIGGSRSRIMRTREKKLIAAGTVFEVESPGRAEPMACFEGNGAGRILFIR